MPGATVEGSQGARGGVRKSEAKVLPILRRAKKKRARGGPMFERRVNHLMMVNVGLFGLVRGGGGANVLRIDAARRTELAAVVLSMVSLRW